MPPSLRGWRRRSRTRAALAEHIAWLRDDALPRANDDWQTGPEQFEQLVALRRLEADGDEILAVGEQMLADESAARLAVAPRSTRPSAAEVGDLVKDDHPATFPEALEAYRDAMDRARTFMVEQAWRRRHSRTGSRHRDAGLPAPRDPIRRLLPAGAIRRRSGGHLHRHATRLTGHVARAQLRLDQQHLVHEAYPGHHLQLAAANANPSLVRALSRVRPSSTRAGPSTASG